MSIQAVSFGKTVTTKNGNEYKKHTQEQLQVQQ